jgi:uncharacterized protein YqgC (DUF456 family)
VQIRKEFGTQLICRRYVYYQKQELQMSSIFVIVVVISFLFGIRKPLVGCIAGTIATAISYYLFIEDFDLLIFFIVTAVGLVLSLLVAYFSSWFFSGFRGGKRHTGPSIIGGFGKGQTAHRGSGIILSDEEREGIKPEHRKK